MTRSVRRYVVAGLVAVSLALGAGVAAADDDPNAFWRALCAPWSDSHPMYYALGCNFLPPLPGRAAA